MDQREPATADLTSTGGVTDTHGLWRAVRRQAARSHRLRTAVAVARAIRRAAGARELDRYAQASSSPEDPALASVAERTRSLSADAYMMAGQTEGGLLTMLVHAMQPRLVLEIGTFTGYGALAMARALPANGRIITCEVDPGRARIARRHIDASPYAAMITVEVGPAMDTITGLPGPFDLVFIDADKTGYLDYYQAVLPRLSPHGLIVVDNTLHLGLVPPGAGDVEAVTAIRRFNSAVAQDPRVEQLLLTLADGLTLIRRVDGAATSA